MACLISFSFLKDPQFFFYLFSHFCYFLTIFSLLLWFFIGSYALLTLLTSSVLLIFRPFSCSWYCEVLNTRAQMLALSIISFLWGPWLVDVLHFKKLKWCVIKMVCLKQSGRKSVLNIVGRADTEAETPILWPPDVKNWVTGKDPDAGKDCKEEEKGTTEDEMAGWHYWLNGHEFEQAPGVGVGQGGLVCCSPWSRKESNVTEWLNWSFLILEPTDLTVVF